MEGGDGGPTNISIPAHDASLPKATTPEWDTMLMSRNLITNFHPPYIRPGPKNSPSVSTRTSEEVLPPPRKPKCTNARHPKSRPDPHQYPSAGWSASASCHSSSLVHSCQYQPVHPYWDDVRCHFERLEPILPYCRNMVLKWATFQSLYYHLFPLPAVEPYKLSTKDCRWFTLNDLLGWPIKPLADTITAPPKQLLEAAPAHSVRAHKLQPGE